VTTRGQSFELTDAAASCDAALQNLRASIAEADGTIHVAPLPKVFADATQLTQLFQNLIGNAIKYQDHRRPEIHVASRSDGGFEVFSVQDNGIGIESRYFDRIFHMFQRLHTIKQFSGTGIGLTLCRKIVERHGGRIWVESQPGEGSTFFFTMPRAEGAHG
jgi:light-regulated signal transduction histidine kinase (bacteriophytochrome)